MTLLDLFISPIFPPIGPVFYPELTSLFSDQIAAHLPRLLFSGAFLILATIGVKLALTLLSRVLTQMFPEENDRAYRKLITIVVTLFLWFGVLLTFLSIIGLEELAAALGTATGFLALGVSYALKDMVADVVAGVYLIRDPDFNVGDTVTVDGITGVVETIELRKTRFNVDGNIEVRANGKIEGKWTKHDDAHPGEWEE